MSASDFLKGSITKKHLAGATPAPLEMAADQPKKPGDQPTQPDPRRCPPDSTKKDCLPGPTEPCGPTEGPKCILPTLPICQPKPKKPTG